MDKPKDRFKEPFSYQSIDTIVANSSPEVGAPGTRAANAGSVVPSAYCTSLARIIGDSLKGLGVDVLTVDVRKTDFILSVVGAM